MAYSRETKARFDRLKTNVVTFVVPMKTLKIIIMQYRAGVNSKSIGIGQFNCNSIPELEQELELKDLEKKMIESELELELKDSEINWH